jgi:mannonate dehydratase
LQNLLAREQANPGAAVTPPVAGAPSPQFGLGGGTSGPAAPGAGQGRGAAPGRGGAPGGGGNQAASLQRIKQLGVNHVIGGVGGGFPWTEENVRTAVQRVKDAGLTLYNSMLTIPATVIYGRDGRDADIEKIIASIQAAGKAGLPVIEYNFYAHRATEGYFNEVGRGNSVYEGFDYERELAIDDSGRVIPEGAKKVKFKDLPPLANEGAHKLDEMWNNISYMLKKVIPVCEKSNVRMALHPNDPPAPVSRGSEQIMGSLKGWKHLIEIVNSPANGITFDCGVTREMGENPVEVAEYFASRKRINHMHYRNISVVKPYERYTEVFIDAGMTDLFGVMKALVKNKYNQTIYPEHPRGLDYDRDRGGNYTAFAYNVAYARAMMQAALETV